MAGSSFEQLMEEVLNQKRYMEELLAENYGLRRQLAGLRDGRGIFLEIQGQRFSLVGETAADYPLVVPEQQETIVAELATTMMPISAELATTITPISEAAIGSGIPLETPTPCTDEFEQLPYALNQEEGLAKSSSILESLLVDEFAAAATSPMAVWKGSKTRKLVPIDEEEKAALRKQLVGSFLLE